jgi:hypothetical protein
VKETTDMARWTHRLPYADPNPVTARHDQPEMKRGQVWEVVSGRKYPIGARGRVFWWGKNRWGVTVGLATTDRKDANGKNRDVIFVAYGNLRFVSEAR